MDDPPVWPSAPRERPRVPKQFPIRVNTSFSTSSSPSVSSAGSSISSSAPTYSFLQSPPPMTAPVGRQFGNRSRSSSINRIGGVVHTSRPRADSEAARMAMEVMVQARLDQIKARLNNLNARSNELHTQTQQLSDDFHEKAKRLYVVEDHMLRIQGKPGLPEAYLEHGTRPRRLTNDLEDLHMGVKTLRRKFQAAGAAITAANWLKNTKGTRGHAHYGHDAMTVDTSRNEDLHYDSSLPSPEYNGSRRIMTHSASSSISMLTDSTDDTSLRSPPLTPRVGSSVMLQTFEDRMYAHNLKTRPLSSIPDQDEPLQASSSRSPTISTRSIGSADESHRERKTLSSYSSLLDSDADDGIGSTFEHDQHDNEPLLDLLHAFPTPASSYSSMHHFHHHVLHPGNADGIAVAFLGEPGQDWKPSIETQQQEQEQQEREQEEEQEEEQGEEQEEEQEQEQEQQELFMDRHSVTTLTTLDEPCSRTLTSSTLAAAAGATLIPTVVKADSTDKVQPMVARGTDKVDSQLTHRHENNRSQDTNLDKNQSQSRHQDGKESQEGWVQALWRFLIRAEYFLLGTAVLGAIMPDNLIALCAGFVSAIMYGILVIRHRLTAPAGKSASSPPNGPEVLRKKYKAVTNSTSLMKQRLKSTHSAS
ncbi:hypothetical protein BGX34_010256 [Mortierella sp. NVP85]|nr:hypothetical protein BGX34_010256 [Mortierella sp. NVP85]